MKVYTSGQEISAGVRAPEAFTSRGGLNGGMLISGSIAQTNSFCQQMGGRKGAFRVVGKHPEDMLSGYVKIVNVYDFGGSSGW